jgi:hypothetical protein
VAWLCSDAAAGVTGQVFHASGGAIGAWNASASSGPSSFRGDHRHWPPWTLDELDKHVRKFLLET